ncbi:MAG: YdbC family protein [Oscillospiraceae bacterium]|nr:YdbC family protein [Oscillospiraceae bacterium]
MAELTYEITETLGVLSENAKGWTKELNLISWNGREPKYDIREWSPDHTRMGKGVTLTNEEFDMLKAIINGEITDDDEEGIM